MKDAAAGTAAKARRRAVTSVRRIEKEFDQPTQCPCTKATVPAAMSAGATTLSIMPCTFVGMKRTLMDAVSFVRVSRFALPPPPVPTLARMSREAGEKLIVDNRRARHEYHLGDRVEAGLVLMGTEVKSLRAGEATLRQAYAEVRDGEAWLVGLHVPEYSEGNRANHDPDRPRKLLLHRREIERLASGVAEKGFTLVPTKLYFRDGRVKVELARARGKELRDKRRDIAARDARRQIERELKSLRR